MAYSGSLMGPPAIGAIAQGMGMHVAIAYIVGFSALIAFVAGRSRLLKSSCLRSHCSSLLGRLLMAPPFFCPVPDHLVGGGDEGFASSPRRLR